MSQFQRVKGIMIGLILILFAILLMEAPKDNYYLLPLTLTFSLLLYGLRMLWFYFTMARHMVGGKRLLYQSVLVLDLGLFSITLVSSQPMYILIYLVGIYAFTGVVSILRAFEEKKQGASSWKRKMAGGCLTIAFTVTLIVVSIAAKSTAILVYGYGAGLIYTAFTYIISSFRKTAIVYIQ